jgi:hypothetical protein
MLLPPDFLLIINQPYCVLINAAIGFVISVKVSMLANSEHFIYLKY